MTWPRAAIALVIGILADLAGGFFSAFWFFGPALGVGLCTGGVRAVAGEFVGVVTAAGGCTIVVKGVQLAADFFTVGGFTAGVIVFGSVMALLVGIMGWGAVGVLLLMTNRRIFKQNATSVLWFLGGFAFDQIPVINALPAITPTVFRLYRAQIRKDKSELAAYERRKAELETQESAAQAEAYMALLAQKRAELERAQGIPDALPQAI